MKKTLCIFLAILFISLTACSQYAEPDVGELTDLILSEQTIEEITYASESDVGILFDIDLDRVEAYRVCYSGKGGYADMIAVFKLKNSVDADSVSSVLEKYKSDRYEDFKGYAPLEAKKIEKGRIMVYGRYVLLVVVPDISAAQKTIDAAFSV